MPDEDARLRALTDAVHEMKVSNATSVATLRTVQEAVARIERLVENHVTRREFDDHRNDVSKRFGAVEADIEKQASNWAKIAWFIGLTIAGAMLAFLLSQTRLPA